MLIEGFRIQNFGNIRDLSIGKIDTESHIDPLRNATVFIGSPGSGKNEVLTALKFFMNCITNSIKKWRPIVTAYYPIFTIFFDGKYCYKLYLIQPNDIDESDRLAAIIGRGKQPYIHLETLSCDNKIILMGHHNGDTLFNGENNKIKTIKLVTPRRITALNILGSFKEEKPLPSIMEGIENLSIERNPDNGLHHSALQELASECRYGSSCFLTTNRPNFLNHFDPDDVWLFKKNNSGEITANRISDDPLITNLVEDGLPLGGLWTSGYFDAPKKGTAVKGE